MSEGNRLPAYLRAVYHAEPAAGAAVVSGGVRFTVITPRLIRIEEGAFTDALTQAVICRAFRPSSFETDTDAGVLTLRTEALELEYREGQPLNENTLRIRLRAGDTETVWRYGQKPAHPLKGTTSTLDQVNGDRALEDSVCSREGFGLMDDSGSALFGKDGWFESRQPCTDLYFFGYGRDYTACVKDYCLLTGAPSLLPAFALGNWWSRYYRYSQQEYLDLMDEFRARNIPLSVGIVDMDWHLTDGDGREYWTDGWTGYTWNRELFPDPQAFLKGLKERNLRTALNLHPALGVRAHEEQYRDMAEARGIDPESGKPVPCDYLDPSFYQPYMEILHFPMEKDGVDFWWMDWQQGSDYQRLVGEENYRPNTLESMNPLWLMNHMHYMASARNGGRGMIFSRYCGHGSQRYPIGFSGDTVISWESLRFQPAFTARASNVGYGWWSHDIGGHHKGYRDDELTVRWVQLGVFSPIFRLHSTSSIFLGREPWNYEPRSEAVIENFMRLRHRLFPYLYTMNRRASEELLPLVRPMYHTHPEEPETYRLENEYWFGSQMIAAPVTEKHDPVSGMGKAEAWLPEGLWTDAFTGVVYSGGTTVTAHRPPESLPVFLKAGAIVPLQETAPGSNVLGGAADMTVVLAPGGDGSFTLYEDDGITARYKDGFFAETPMSLRWRGTEATFTVHPRRGDPAAAPSRRRFVLQLTGFAEGTEAFLQDGTALTAVRQENRSLTRIALPETEAETGIAVTLRNASGLTDRNASARSRCVDLLTRAQCSLPEKEMMLKQLDDVAGRIRNGESFDSVYHLLSCGFDDQLYGAVRELIREWAAAGSVPFTDRTAGRTAPPCRSAPR